MVRLRRTGGGQEKSHTPIRAHQSVRVERQRWLKGGVATLRLSLGGPALNNQTGPGLFFG